MDNIALGKKIAEFRTQNKLSMRQLAEKINLTASMLSQIERGRANPSLNTLRMIANCLEVPLFSFFLEYKSSNDLVVRSGARKLITFPPNDVEYSLLSPDLGGALEMSIMKLPPYAQSAQNLLSHIGEEVAYVLRGDIVIHLGDESVVLNTDDSVKIPPGLPHKWENPADTEAIVIFAITPPSF